MALDSLAGVQYFLASITDPGLKDPLSGFQTLWLATQALESIWVASSPDPLTDPPAGFQTLWLAT